jgi:hypothetical protein
VSFKANVLQETQLLGLEYVEKIKILQNEIDLLRAETETKEAVVTVSLTCIALVLMPTLQEEKISLQATCTERDLERGEINKATYTVQLKEGTLA